MPMSMPTHALLNPRLLSSPNPSPGRAPILVVDDDEDLRETLVMVLDIEGFPVSHGATSAEALDYLRAAECCHVVLLDYALWGGNTETLLCAGDHDARLARHSYALMTGRELAQFSDEAMRLISAHCTEFLLKPFDLEQLLGVVKRATAHLSAAPERGAWRYDGSSSDEQ